jgi:hypothetical protein
VSTQSNRRRKRGKGVNKKKPNFVKSNSLGLLSAAKFHSYMGPAQINWDGGWSGERKIQPVKPLLSIKRANAEWQRTMLNKLYQNEAIDWLLESTALHQSHFLPVDKKDRSMGGVIKIHSSLDDVNKSLEGCEPIMGVLAADNTIWIPFRPTGRSPVDLLQVMFDDENGNFVQSLCWMSPIQKTTNVHHLKNTIELSQFAKEYILLLPQLTLEGNTCHFSNNYYCIGNSWTERNRIGEFVTSSLDLNLFGQWILTDNSNLDALHANV